MLGLAKGENPGPFRRGLSIDVGLLHGDRHGFNRKHRITPAVSDLLVTSSWPVSHDFSGYRAWRFLLHCSWCTPESHINSRGPRFARNGTCEYEDCWYAHGAQIAGERWAALLDFDYLKSCDYLKSWVSISKYFLPGFYVCNLHYQGWNNHNHSWRLLQAVQVCQKTKTQPRISLNPTAKLLGGNTNSTELWVDLWWTLSSFSNMICTLIFCYV